jgi:hypothetical protein
MVFHKGIRTSFKRVDRLNLGTLGASAVESLRFFPPPLRKPLMNLRSGLIDSNTAGLTWPVPGGNYRGASRTPAVGAQSPLVTPSWVQ